MFFIAIVKLETAFRLDGNNTKTEIKIQMQGSCHTNTTILGVS